MALIGVYAISFEDCKAMVARANPRLDLSNIVTGGVVPVKEGHEEETIEALVPEVTMMEDPAAIATINVDS